MTRRSDDLFQDELEQTGIDFENEGGETYICGNPPYVGKRNRDDKQKQDVQRVLGESIKGGAALDYVFCWILIAAEYVKSTSSQVAFVTTNSVTQGTQVSTFWPFALSDEVTINFAHRSFHWANNAAHNAGVTCVVVGFGRPRHKRDIYDEGKVFATTFINPYLLPSDTQVVSMASSPLFGLPKMRVGNVPNDGNFLSVSFKERYKLVREDNRLGDLILRMYGAQEMIRGLVRYCLWFEQHDLDMAYQVPEISRRLEAVRNVRKLSKDPTYNVIADRPHQFRDRFLAKSLTILLATISSENREYYPATIEPGRTATTNQVYCLYDAPLWCVSLIVSKLHLAWVGTVCGKLKTDYRYSNTLGWNTFPVPPLTEDDKAELTRCAEDVLLAREAHFPATLADLYDPEAMPDNLRVAHDRNDETLERIYIGRRFKNDTERLETLFSMYAKMTEKPGTGQTKQAARKPRTKRVVSVEVRT